MSLSTKVLLGLVLGIATGLFFGEVVAPLEVVGEAFIKLLQMTVLPYLTVSLVAGLASLTYSDALSLAKKGGLVMLFLWAVALSTVLLMPLAFPDWVSASFFSTALVRDVQEFDFLNLYIPANPFNALANNTVPAVVLFSMAVGVALIGVQNKDMLNQHLNIVVEALMRVTHFVVLLAPLGVFAIAADAAGTMNVSDFGRWQVYLVTYVAAWCLLSFWVLPVLVTCLTPLTYREVVWFTKDALITALATGNLLVVLPVIAEKSKALIGKYGLNTKEAESAVDVIIPISFTFPSTGKLLGLSFVLFAGWFSGGTVSLTQYPSLTLSGFFSFFGAPTVAIPFLLDLLRIPADLFELFVLSDVLIGRFGVLLAAMHTLVLAILGTFAMSGRLKFDWRKLALYAVLSLILGFGSLGAVRLLFTVGFEPIYTKYRSFIEMELLGDGVPATVQTTPSEVPLPSTKGKPRLETILERGTLRVGYFKDHLPFAFTNAHTKLVGFDVEMAHRLAKELGVTLEFIRLDQNNMAESLNSGQADIIMSGLVTTAQRVRSMTLSKSYMDTTLAFIVKDHWRDEFSQWETIQQLDFPRIGVPKVHYFTSIISDRLPKAKIVPMDSVREYFRKEWENLDAFALGAETSAAWTLVYPNFQVTVPLPNPVKIPLAYAMPRGESDMVDFINTWIDLKKKDHTIDVLFEHWILGKHALQKGPRWSVIRDVLHWID
jgi:Na+/H+-dicarboxylate symporter